MSSDPIAHLDLHRARVHAVERAAVVRAESGWQRRRRPPATSQRPRKVWTAPRRWTRTA